MAISKKIKSNILHSVKEINEIKKLLTDKNIESLEVKQSEYLTDKEYDTISYKFGKTLIDSKKDIASAISAPRKLVSIYLESKKRSQKKDIKLLETSKVIVRDSENHTKTISYKKIDDFIVSEENIEEDISSQKLIDIFGIKSGKKVFTLTDEKIYFETIPSEPVYTASQKIWHTSKYSNSIVTASFNFKKADSLDLVVIISFFDNKSNNRIHYNMLPINKNLNITIPPNAVYFNLGLKVTGEGVLEKQKIMIGDASQPSPTKTKNYSLDEGMSIIIPSYKGEKTIIDTLESIKKQKNINLDLLEIIIVINGEKDSTEEKIIEFSNNQKHLNIVCSYTNESGASEARNIAIEKASKEYLIFCDDDDLLSDEYIAGLYKIRDLESIGFCSIYDMKEDGQIVRDNNINRKLIQSLTDSNYNVENFTSAITMIASKIIPTKNIKDMLFDKNLRSGEDVVFFTDYYVRYNPKLIMCKNEKTYYIRRLRENSLSRKEMSFDFNVVQRLDVLKSLLNLKNSILKEEQLQFIDTKIRAQCGFIINYLKENPKEYKNIHLAIVKKDIKSFPYRYLQDRANLTDPSLLVISYCHPPFVDTSAVVAAKRVFEFNEICDVVCADMSKVRAINPELSKINRHLVRDSFVLSTNPTFGGWSGIYEFASAIDSLVDDKNYTSVYSRSFWPASHFAAFEYKRKHPEVKWIAEFSDPIILDIEGNARKADISIDWVKEIIADFGLDYSLINEDNLYVWCELIVYIFADEIIFTCENQRKLMTNSFPHQKYINRIENHNQIIPHPTLPKEFYESNQIDYKLDESKVNFAYFGAFYKTRRLDDLIDALHSYKSNVGKYKKLKSPLIHIFTEQVDAAKEMVEEEGLDKYFIINNYVNYFDFLNISKAMDVLIVNDAKAKDMFGFNPYLPSKLSDYLGSSSKIWGFYEKNSAISFGSKENYYTELSKGEGFKTLIQILSESLNKDLIESRF